MTAPSTNGTHKRNPLTKGVYVPTVAFFQPDEEVDVAATERHAAYLARSGVTGLVTQGSNGEAVHLDREERKAITSATRRGVAAAGFPSLPIIAGCGAASTRETIQHCRDAAVAGADAVLVLPPSYYQALVNTDALHAHFIAVAEASPLPVLLYNFPGASAGVDLSSDDILTLSAHPNIVGCKLTCGNTGKLARVAAGAKPDFLTFGGSADFTLQTLVAGGDGVIAGTANLIPRSCAAVMDLYERGQLEEAQRVQAIVARADWVAVEGGFIAVKSALQSYHGYGGLPRRPCVMPTEKAAATIHERFREGLELERSLEKSLKTA
ncbi:putative 4-hydroxy-2-oxoglutarate aldolase [Penicillium oxalicum]|uniref:putative 4-hydroxy-2-oxoglutarate aldolase n=1 Tax=Penicillium oxalicum TaxID=69781 RepID=UPI0020B8600A|nr:putative 4-hydroxy-2-oxoglutarate aldolase [Penicillium oxalicum]KAI2786067.1 putative 4-hydroxy-2-oxoglutarate aldolase [Penicillium oxalicum]